MKDQHVWVRNGIGSEFYCKNCPAKARQAGSAWPPLRTATWIEADTCEKARNLKRDQLLRQQGIDPSEVS